MKRRLGLALAAALTSVVMVAGSAFAYINLVPYIQDTTGTLTKAVPHFMKSGWDGSMDYAPVTVYNNIGYGREATILGQAVAAFNAQCSSSHPYCKSLRMNYVSGGPPSACTGAYTNESSTFYTTHLPFTVTFCGTNNGSETWYGRAKVRDQCGVPSSMWGTSSDVCSYNTNYNHHHIIRGWVEVDGADTAGLSDTALKHVFMHELGHTLGLGHRDDPSSIMYYSLSGAGGHATLNNDDIAWLWWIYMNANESCAIGGCGWAWHPYTSKQY